MRAFFHHGIAALTLSNIFENPARFFGLTYASGYLCWQ